MADPITGALVSQLSAIIEQQIRENIKLVVNVDKEIEKLKSTLISIQAVIVDADNKQVKEHSIKLWLERLGDVCYDLDDVLAEWSIALFKFQRENNTPKEKVFFSITFPCFCFGKIIQRRDIALKIEKLYQKLNEIHLDRQNYTLNDSYSSNEDVKKLPSNSFVEDSKVIGRDQERTNLVKELLKEREDGLNIVSVVGMGGIGKTTLAQLAYNSDEVKLHFKMRLWVVVSEPFDVVRIARAILENIEHKAPELYELDNLLGRLREKIQGKRYLLVLDDVWTYDIKYWEALISSLGVGASGSTLLVTTRNKQVAEIICSKETIQLKEISCKDCWDLFSQYAFFDRRNEDLKHLEPIGRDIANKCKGLPLAAKTIGSLMRFKNSVDDWKNVLKSDTWDLEEANGVKLLPALLLSYYALEEYAWRRCFRYCAIFPKDTEIEAETLINLWMANGYLVSKGNKDMEDIGKEYLNNLAMRCFFQNLERDDVTNNIVRFKMHDMVHDLAQYLTKNECSTIEVVDDKLPRTGFRHLTLVIPKDVSFQCIEGDTTKLHTLWVYSKSRYTGTTVKFSHVFFENLLHVKVLDISVNSFKEVSNEIEKLLNLRCLNLSNSRLLEELPEAVCELYNLQTLKLNYCKSLKRLPQGIGKLGNLRHLELFFVPLLEKSPKGIRNLRFLKTLSTVVISSINDDPGTFTLGDLKDLNQLRGTLLIKGLGYADVANAKKAELKEKHQLVKLNMNFKPTSLSSQEVAEALEPHPDVKVLTISDYGGAQLPNWIFSLNNLRKLLLMSCPNCTILPPFGNLQYLEELTIWDMQGVKRIGEEFLGIEAYNNNGAIDIFPKLKSLRFDKMQSWEEWDLTSTAIAKRVEDGNLRIMPCLGKLVFHRCSQLKEMPPLGILQSLETLILEDMPGVKRIGDEFLGIEAYRKIDVIDIFPKLKSLGFYGMSNWEEWDFTSTAIAKRVEDGNLRIMPCLQKLKLYDCVMLKQVPEIILQTTPIQKPLIRNCPFLEQKHGINILPYLFDFYEIEDVI